MNRFRRGKIGDFLTLQRGFDITKKEQAHGQIPVISSSGIASYHNDFKVKGPGVVIGRKGTLGTAFYVKSNYWPHDTSLWVKDFKGNEPEFIYYFLKTLPLEKLDSGSANPTLNRNVVHLLDACIPILDDQRKIAAVLSALDAKIALNHRINGELEGMAKLLYDYWFVQYNFPLSAAQAAALGKPHLTGKPYRTSGGPMVYHDHLKREIPKGWKVGNLSELGHLNHRTWPNKDHPDQVTYLDLANAKNGEILSVQNFAWDEAPSRARRILTPGDTIFGTVRPGNRSFALVPKSDQILTGSTGFAVLTPRSSIYREFNYLSLTSESNINRLTTVASGAAYPAVNPEVVAAQTIALPDTDLIHHFHQTTASFFDLIERHRAQNQELTTLRDWLLPMLMNGQVRVYG